MKNQKVILAYSGGLDTSVALRWLTERGYSVVAFCTDLGQEEAFGPIKERALRCGAKKVIVRDLKAVFCREYILPALQAGAVYEGKYLLATALGRPLIAQGLVEAAQQERARVVAHGCTGKGNDQVRIEVSVRILNPNLKILAPVREWELRSRGEEIRYALARRLPIEPRKKSRFSVDQNLWGVSIESGPLEDPWKEPPREAYLWTKDPSQAPSRPEQVTIGFQRGVPVTLNGRRISLQTLIERLNTLGAKHGVGRTDLMEDRLVGIKSREVYEAPAATILHAVHQELEQLILDREIIAFKESVAHLYSRLIYDGLWFTPLKRALDAFVQSTQEKVTGSVRVRLFKGAAVVVGRRSPFSLYTRLLATYEGKGTFDQKAAAGFIQLWGLPYLKAPGSERSQSKAGARPSSRR